VSDSQRPLEELDLSFILRTIMATRGLTVQNMADLAGVSKSAMEKYLAGPSSPRAVAIASLSKGLGLSADTLLFGVIDQHIELAYQIAFREMASLIEDLKTDPTISSQVSRLEPGSEAFSAFVRNLAFERAGQLKRQFNVDRRDRLVATILPPFTSF
jgi:transcriptional regulator with XRE-family HTH domain